MARAMKAQKKQQKKAQPKRRYCKLELGAAVAIRNLISNGTSTALAIHEHFAAQEKHFGLTNLRKVVKKVKSGSPLEEIVSAKKGRGRKFASKVDSDAATERMAAGIQESGENESTTITTLSKDLGRAISKNIGPSCSAGRSRCFVRFKAGRCEFYFLSPATCRANI